MSNGIQRLNPSSLFNTDDYGYSQISIVDPGRIAHVSGQAGIRADGSVPSEDLAEQTVIALENVQTVLKELRARRCDIITMNCYAIDLDTEAAVVVLPMVQEFLGHDKPCLAMIGVESLAIPELKVAFTLTVRVPD